MHLAYTVRKKKGIQYGVVCLSLEIRGLKQPAGKECKTDSHHHCLLWWISQDNKKELMVVIMPLFQLILTKIYDLFPSIIGLLIGSLIAFNVIIDIWFISQYYRSFDWKPDSIQCYNWRLSAFNISQFKWCRGKFLWHLEHFFSKLLVQQMTVSGIL